jgi:hypothetical protein
MNKPKPAAMAAQVKYATRFGAEKARQQRRYCDAFRLWRSCHFAPCLRSRRCRGDADACLAKAVALDRVPHREQSRGAAGHSRRHAAQYRRARARGAAMHAARFLFKARKVRGA